MNELFTLLKEGQEIVEGILREGKAGYCQNHLTDSNCPEDNCKLVEWLKKVDELNYQEGYDWCQRCGEEAWSLEFHQCKLCGFVD